MNPESIHLCTIGFTQKSAKEFFEKLRAAGVQRVIDVWLRLNNASQLAGFSTALIQTIAQAEFWRSELLLQPEKSLERLTAEYGIKPRYIRRLLNAAYLAPAIKRAIFRGTQPAHLQVQDLIAEHSLDWQLQMRELEFENSTAVA